MGGHATGVGTSARGGQGAPPTADTYRKIASSPDPHPLTAAPVDADGGWLCPTEAHRVRLLDMGVRVRKARGIAMGACAVGLAAASPLIGWPMLPMFVVALVTAGTLDRRVERSARPERLVAAAFGVIIVLMGVSAALTGNATSPVLPLLVVPVALSTARFRAAVVWAIAAFALLVALAAALTGGPAHAFHHPLALIAVAVLMVAVTAATTALMDAELQYRRQSVLDPLTGLLNRSGLEARFREVAEQARLLGRPVCVIMCDLDNFKTVNDVHGHERGDRVLREISYEMRKALRSFELFYRLGGEEFLILMPGIDLPDGVATAEALRTVVQDCRPANVALTASFGVSAAIGDEIGFLGLYRAADEALYRSKAAGRNRVVAAGASEPAPRITLPLA